MSDTQIRFATDIENPIKNTDQINDNELVQIFPYGLTLGQEMTQPVMIFKSKDGEYSLPVLMNSLEAGVTLAQSNKGIIPVSPHKATQQIFESLGVKINKCIFVDVKSNSQFVKIFYSQNGLNGSSKVKASDATSLCLHLEVPIFTTKEVITKSKILIAEVDEMKRQLLAKGSGVVPRNQFYIN
jgi:bifunctional DNase/RNase